MSSRRQVSSPNDYAFYYGSFSNAAKVTSAYALKTMISVKKEEGTMNKNVQETKVTKEKANTPKSRKCWNAQNVARAITSYYAEHKQLPPARRYNSAERELGLPSYFVIRRVLGHNRESWLDTANAILGDEANVQQSKVLRPIEGPAELLEKVGALESVVKMIEPIELVSAVFRYKMGDKTVLIKIETEK